MKRLLQTVKLSLVLWTLCLPAMLFAQDELAPVTATYAITNVSIVQSPGRKIDMGTVVIKDGLILSVGKNVPIPLEAIIIKADSMYVYAGFIDGLSRAGVTRPKDEQKPKPKDPGNPKPEEAGITPQNDVRAWLSSSEKSIEELRNLGFTVAHVVPYGGMMPGNGAVILLGGKSADEMVLVNNASFYSELTPSQQAYPATVMGVMAKYRELYRQASLTRSYENSYASNRNGIQRPLTDPVLEALFPVIDKRQPVLFKAEHVVDAQRALTLQNDLGFSLILADLKEGWDISNKIKSAGAKVFLSLDLPEDNNKAEDKKESNQNDRTATEKAALEKRKADFIVKYVGQAATFQKAGIKFGFSTMSAKTNSIRGNVKRMMEAGLSEDAALASLTTTPAEFLGLSDRLGTVDNGKIANLVITDKPYFNEKANVRYVFVEGILYKQDIKVTKSASKGSTEPAVIAEGEWTIITQTPQAREEAKLILKKEGNTFTGTIGGGSITPTVNIEQARLEGKALSFKFSFSVGGTPITVDVAVTIDGDTFKGTSSVPQYGSFPTEGKRIPK